MKRASCGAEPLLRIPCGCPPPFPAAFDTKTATHSRAQQKLVDSPHAARSLSMRDHRSASRAVSCCWILPHLSLLSCSSPLRPPLPFRKAEGLAFSFPCTLLTPYPAHPSPPRSFLLPISIGIPLPSAPLIGVGVWFPDLVLAQNLVLLVPLLLMLSFRCSTPPQLSSLFSGA